MIWKTARREIAIGARPLVMGILNLTPDSFSDGGRLATTEMALQAALEMEALGADILDLGAESTRPGASRVNLEAEWARLEPVLKALEGKIGIPLSVDTYKPEIAHRSVDHGVEIVNDVSGGQWEEGIWQTLAECRYGYVLTHSQGRPETMQDSPHYENVTGEIRQYFQEKLSIALAVGIDLDHLVIDPGLGFGKTAAHNWTILGNLNRFQELGRPILVGISRKSFLKKIAGEESLAVSTLAAQVWAAAKGASIWRVHDVAAAVTASRIVEQLQSAGDK